MDSVAFHSQLVFRFPAFFSFSKQLKLGKPIISLKEIVDGHTHFDSRKSFFCLAVSSIRSNDDKRNQPRSRKSDSGRTKNEDENKRPQSSDGKKFNSSNREEIIALFRRVQSSISKGDFLSSDKRSSNSQKDKPSSESILDVLRESGKIIERERQNLKKVRTLRH
ncbi:rho-N domain-containing protein 1, chloroplastic isoform X2 [Quillaja saponaria]|uniref:Rho-N domain-containing protein 1, chloroplastic isoform X2 n=1 Tax=Quillaja saponaria TaxID=32244 RepID=A0AAD7M2G1_QUISA|nr:rho-N domain-containing protein 1, chloroplastic isoform X2 [Quillaja saponaria]